MSAFDVIPITHLLTFAIILSSALSLAGILYHDTSIAAVAGWWLLVAAGSAIAYRRGQRLHDQERST